MSDTKLFPVILMLPVPCESLCQRISRDSKEISLKRKQRKMIFYPETQRINQRTWALSQEPSRRSSRTHTRLFLMGKKKKSCTGKVLKGEKKEEEERGAERKMRKDEEEKEEEEKADEEEEREACE